MIFKNYRGEKLKYIVLTAVFFAIAVLFLFNFNIKRVNAQNISRYPINSEYYVDVQNINSFNLIELDGQHSIKLYSKDVDMIVQKDYTQYEIKNAAFFDDEENDYIISNVSSDNYIAYLYSAKKLRDGITTIKQIRLFKVDKNDITKTKFYDIYFNSTSSFLGQDSIRDIAILKNSERDISFYINDGNSIFRSSITINSDNITTTEMIKIAAPLGNTGLFVNKKHAYTLKDKNLYSIDLNNNKINAAPLISGIDMFSVLSEKLVYLKNNTLFFNDILNQEIKNISSLKLQDINFFKSANIKHIKLKKDRILLLTSTLTHAIAINSKEPNYLVYDNYFSVVGDSLYKLNRPSLIRSFRDSDNRDYTILIDEANNRVIRYLISDDGIMNTKVIYSSVDNKAKLVAISRIDGDIVSVAALQNNYIFYTYNNKTENIDLSNKGNILDIKFLNSKLYLLVNKNGNSKVYVYNNIKNMRVEQVCEIANEEYHKMIPSQENKFYFYNKTQRSIDIYDAKNKNLISSISYIELDKLDDLALDITGNFYILYQNKIAFLKRDSLIKTKEPLNIPTIPISIYSEEIKSISISGNKIYYTDARSNTFTSIVTTKIQQERDPLLTRKINKYSIYKIKNKATLLKVSNMYENSILLNNSSDKLFLVIAVDENMWFGYTNTGKFGYISKDELSSTTLIKNTYNNFNNLEVTNLHYGGINIYSMPVIGNIFYKQDYLENVKNSQHIMNIIKNNITTYRIPKMNIQIISNLAGSENKHILWQGNNLSWYQVTFKLNNKSIIGYALSTDLANIATIKKSGNKERLKVAGEKIGVAVNVYAADSEDSTIIASLPDATVVELLSDKFDKNSKFTKIKFMKDGDLYYTVGYIKSEFLQSNSLTSIQKIALLVTSIFILTSIILLLIVFRRKKIRNY